MKKIGFFTGARSEYGIMKKLIQRLSESHEFEYSLFVSGLHFLKTFGHTIDEIRSDGLKITAQIEAFQEDLEPGYEEFVKIIRGLSDAIRQDKPDAVFIIGDRPESYAAAIACHFQEIDIIHSGGGTVTYGAVDNVYRYNISNLATVNLTTSRTSYKRLREVPSIDKDKVFFTGSMAIDAIQEFLKSSEPIAKFVPELIEKEFCLMTFHPVTMYSENVDEAMDFSIRTILEFGHEILITYPNNDKGFRRILDVIEKWKNHPMVHIREHLGAQGYYAALNDCSFVIGNSSSGLMEAPYFSKRILNIGSRQLGREIDVGVISIPSDTIQIRTNIEEGFNQNWSPIKGENLHGDGNSLERIIEVFKGL